LGCSAQGAAQGDPLPSWNDTPTKQAIIDFVDRVTKAGGPDFVAPADRIATFDNDGFGSNNRWMPRWPSPSIA
jgi:hypothetical protein